MAHSIEQGSLEWFKQRLGCFNGSEVGDIMTSSKTKGEVFGKTALQLISKVAAERLINPKILDNDMLFQSYIDQNTTSTKAMDWGHEQEANARKLYEKLNNITVEECESIPHPEIPFFRSSPDGYIVGSDVRGCLEIKCLGIANFGKYMLNLSDAQSLKSLNSTYYWQCFAHMAVTGASYTDFFCFCPWLTKPYLSIRIERDEDEIAKLEDRVRLANQFIEEFNKH